MEWTDDQTAQLRTLWAEGHSTAEIGRRLGCGKNAVAGKAHRLDLPARPSPIRAEGSGVPRVRRRRGRHATLPAFSADLLVAPREPIRSAGRPVVAAPSFVRSSRVIYARACQWVTCEGDACRPWLFCEAPSTRGSYCSVHAARCYAGLRVVADQRVAA